MQKIKLLEFGFGLLFLTVVYFIIWIPLPSYTKHINYEEKYKQQVEATKHIGICSFFTGLSLAFIISGIVARENKKPKTDTKA